jgi:phage minor structural protein
MAELVILNRHEVPVAVLSTDAPGACPFFDDTHTERLEDGFATYEFSVPLDHEDALKIEARGYVLLRDLDGNFQLFRIETVEDQLTSDGTRIRHVIAESAATELNNDIVRPMTLTGATATQALDAVLAGTRWQRGIVEWLGSLTIELLDYPTVLAGVHKIRSEFGAEIRFRVEYDGGRIVGRYVDLLQQRGNRTGKRFEYQKDLAGATRTEDTTQLCTALIGLGKADDQGNRLTFANVEWRKANGDPVDKPLGQDWVGDPDALQTWGVNGKHVFGVYEDSEEEDPAKLLQKTWDELQNRINGRYTYEVEVATLERVAGYEHEAVRLGDTVTVHDYANNQPIVLEARVIEVQRSYSDPSRDKVVLGRYRPLMTSLPQVVAELQATIRRKQAQWEAGENIYKASTPPDNPSDGQLWLDMSVVPNVLKRYDASTGTWVKATPTQAGEVGAEKQVTKSNTAPSNPQVGDLWLDTSTTPNVLKRWDGSAWVKATPTAANEVGAEKQITKSATAPSNPQVGDLWLDTSVTPNVLKRWTGTAWVKATPTTASEVGAETPQGAQEKANAAEQNARNYADQRATEAEQNARSYTDQVAERKIARGTTPPASPRLNDVWIDTSTAPPVWKFWNGTSWEKMTRTNFAELYGQITGQQIAPNAIEPTHIAWLDASLITAGTMLADRIRGGTLELGGTSNGVLSLKDASGNEKVRGDTTGMTVTDANFFVLDAQSQVRSIIRAHTNMINDHSFEGIGRLGSVYSDYTFDVDTTQIGYGNDYWWYFVGDGPHRILSTYNTDDYQRALFDFQAAVVYVGYSRPRQYVSPDMIAGLNGPYTLSAYFAAWEGTTISGNARLEIWAVDANYTRLKGWSTNVYIDANQKYKWKRGKVTIPAGDIPANTYMFEVTFWGDVTGMRYLVDGVQLVPFDHPTEYQPESSLWRHLNGLAGHIANILYAKQAVATDRIQGITSPEVIYLGTTGPSVDMAGGTARWRQSSTNYIRQLTDGTVEIVIGGVTKHRFRTDGTKTGGTIEIDGKIFGMSPVDSPRVLIQDVMFDVEVTEEGKLVELEPNFAKAIDGYTVFPSRSDVVVRDKTATSFVVAGPAGPVDLLIVGKRVGYENTYWMPINTPSSEE